jgi:hypothetical protein
MTIKISQTGQFYAVNVSETMTAKETILVFADSPEESRKIARQNVSFSYDDFGSDGVYTFIAKKNPPIDFLSIYDYIIVDGCEYPVEEFLKEFLNSEEYERRRIAEIEKDNGQIALEL